MTTNIGLALIGGWGIAVAAITPAAAQTAAASSEPKLSGAAIEAQWFDGKPFLATAPDGTVFRMTFSAGGKALKAPADKKGAATGGFWRVIAEGYCVRWTGGVREKCFNIRVEAGKTVARFGQQVVAEWARAN